jgi:transposase
VVEHRLHKRRCGCGAVTTAAAPAGVGAPAVYGPNLRALAVHLLVFQHIPVARTAALIADLTGARPSTGWDQLGAGDRGRPVGRRREADQVVDHAGAGDPRRRDQQQHQRRPVVDARRLHPDAECVCPAPFPRPGGGHRLRRAARRSAERSCTTRCRSTTATTWPATPCVGRTSAGSWADPDQDWPQQALRALHGLNSAAHQARDQQLTEIPPEIADPLLDSWRHALLVGLAEHRRAPERRQTKTRNLLERLRDRDEQVLLFARDLSVPFTNNQAERDIRPTKTQLKISGCHRSETTASAWLRIRGYISTVAKHGGNILNALRDAITGNP